MFISFLPELLIAPYNLTSVHVLSKSVTLSWQVRIALSLCTDRKSADTRHLALAWLIGYTLDHAERFMYSISRDQTAHRK